MQFFWGIVLVFLRLEQKEEKEVIEKNLNPASRKDRTNSNQVNKYLNI